MSILKKSVSSLTTEQIENYAQKLNKEEDVLMALGCNAQQMENAKKNKRWRKHWDIGYAKGLVAKAEDLYNSKDSALQKLYADKVVPQTEAIEMTIEYDAPKWFYEELKVDKVKKARRD